MTKTTRQNSYLVYFRSVYGGTSINSRASNNQRSYEIVSIIFSMYLLMYVLGQAATKFSENGGSMSLLSASGVSWLFYASVLVCGVYLRDKPSVFNLLPISWKKRTVYFYITVLVSAIISVVAMATVLAVIFLITALIAFAATGEWVFTAEESGFAEMMVTTVQGQLFGVFLLILIIGAATLLCFIKANKLRRFMYFVFPVALYIPLLVMINIADPSPSFTLSSNLYGYFENLPLSWLWLVFTAVISVGVLALGVWQLIKHERPKDF